MLATCGNADPINDPVAASAVPCNFHGTIYSFLPGVSSPLSKRYCANDILRHSFLLGMLPATPGTIPSADSMLNPSCARLTSCLLPYCCSSWRVGPFSKLLDGELASAGETPGSVLCSSASNALEVFGFDAADAEVRPRHQRDHIG